jgi:hypothetical protein
LARSEVLATEEWTQRLQLVLLRDRGEISNEVMRRIEHDLDLEDARLKI